MSEQKLVIVSNRLPISVSKENGEIVLKPSSGGLATAMSSLEADLTKRVWIGWPGISSEQLTKGERATVTRKLKELGCVPVFLSGNQVKNFYEGYANDTLWPLFHYFQSLANYANDYWSAYKSVNKLFASVVAKHTPANARIWIHDYHLMLLPDMVRKTTNASSIGFFLHIPFPSFEIFRLLPNRKDILEGLLGADLIGFHTYDYARHFISSTLRTLGRESHHGTILLDDRTVSVDAFPIGIDYNKFTTATLDKNVKKERDILSERYGTQKLILSVDRLDYSKGIPSRLKAFEEFLEQNPHYHKKVSLIIIAVPSRTEVQTYRELRESIEQTVSRINGAYSTVDWTPISYQFQNIPFEQLVALYSKADIALVTPLRDGMNLVAKEYVACKQRDPGVLILSELTGAADELQEAICINPNDSASIVKAIKSALTMSKRAQKKRMHAMQGRISQYTAQRWANDFMEQLDTAKQMQDGRSDKMLTPDDKKKIIDKFKQAKSRAVLLDYDGTLTNFVNTSDPTKAAPSKQLLALLKRLAESPNTDLWIISGRTRAAMEQWFGKTTFNLVAEHGSWVRQDGEWAQGLFSFQEHKSRIKPLLERYAERTPGAHIEEKNFAFVWHYRNVSPELAYARNSSLKHDLNTLLAGTEIGIYSGNKIIEIKPRTIRKSTIVNEIIDSNPPEFVLCAGDDYTDEDMFASLPDTAFTIRVGIHDTNARFQVSSVEKLRALLKSLLA